MNKHNYSTSKCRLLYTIRYTDNTVPRGHIYLYCKTARLGFFFKLCRYNDDHMVPNAELNGICIIGLGIGVELPSSELELNCLVKGIWYRSRN